MKINIQTVARMATVVFLSFVYSLIPANMNAAKKSIIYPDFAYPETVKTKASTNLDASVKSKEWGKSVVAAIEYVTAQNLISHDSVTAGLRKLQELGSIVPSEWKPAYCLIQADIYNSIYNSIRWEANQRKLALDAVPDNPYEWSRDMFAEKVHTLCKEALDYKANSGTPIKEWKTFLKDSSDAISYGVTIDEFVEQKCFELLSTYCDATEDIIPFFGNRPTPVTPSQKCNELRMQAIDSLASESSARNQSVILAGAIIDKNDCLAPGLRMKNLVSALDNLKGTEGSQLILIHLLQYVDESDEPGGKAFAICGKKQYADMLGKSLQEFPKSKFSNGIRNILNDINTAFAEINFDSQYLTSAVIKADVTLTNCNEAWFLVYDYSRYVGAENSPKTKTVAATCPLVKAVKATAEGSVPFKSGTSVEIGKLPYGTYIVIPSKTNNKSGIFSTIENDTWRNSFTVSDISVMRLRSDDGSTKVFVVDGSNGKPIEGATVKVYANQNYREKRKLIQTLTTGKDGYVTVTEKRFQVIASYNGSEWRSQGGMYNSTNTPDKSEHNRAQILANRGLCHPGDSISAAVIGYLESNSAFQLAPETEYVVTLQDANRKEVASKTIKSDLLSRCVADFMIPETGLLGTWRITVCDKKGILLGDTYFQVADYVAPTFFITTEHSGDEFTPGDEVHVKGKVMTYSGMPLAGAMVRYNVTYNTPMRWFGNSGATYDSSVDTDAEGNFEIVLPTANLKDTQFERGIFTMNISATSPAGETQSGPTERFSIGKEYYISIPESDISIDVSDKIRPITVNVVDMLGRKVTKKVNYTLIDITDNRTVAKGDFESPTLNLKDKQLPSAKYRLNVALAEDSLSKGTADIVLWRKTDKTAPAGTGLWVPCNEITAEKGKNSVDITIGNGHGNRWIPVVESGYGNSASVKWVYVGKENVTFTAGAPTGSTSYTLDLNSLSDLRNESATITIKPSTSNNVDVKTVSFRDKVTAGDKENWTFEFTKDNQGIADMPVLAVMTDAALNAIYPFNWNFSPANYVWTPIYRMQMNPAQTITQSNLLRRGKHLSYSGLETPSINDYNQGWGLNGGMIKYGMYRVMNEMKVEAAMPAMMARSANVTSKKMMAAGDMESAEDSIEEVESEAVSAEAGAVAGTDVNKNEDLRATECPVAFFKPYLTTDGKGLVTIDFTVPDFNTTWAFQVIGYDKNLKTAKVTLEAVASKPIMVSTHSPRFVRTGDEMLLTATVFNNSGATCDASGKIELVDLISGKTITVKEFASEKMDNAASRIIKMMWTVPTDVSAVGFRAYAESGSHRDGEQALLPVIPASSPVVESTPFWVAPATGEKEIRLPKFNESDRITLQYCDNPAWYCLTALPDIVYPESKSIISKVRALYGNAMAYNLISSNSNLKAGLETILSDKNSEFAAIRSNLEKDGSLKITELNSTPWVNDAASETLRMSRLSGLLDESEATATIQKLLSEIKELQTPEGGWSWCPDMQPSTFITREVLAHFGMMMNAGAMKKLSDADDMIKSGVAYVDSETVQDYRKYHKKGESLSYLLDWLYVRSQFSDKYLTGKSATEMNRIAEKALTDISSEWKSMGIASKAKAATLLWRYGKKKDASEILESLRQYASKSEEKGVWFDNLTSGNYGIGAIRTTTLALEAFAEIQPGNNIIDGLRQWLILGRQVQDWGKNTYTVETIDAILTTGTDWTSSESNTAPEIYLNGKKITIPVTAAMTGAFTMNLDSKSASKKRLKVSRKGASPAWGGVISQYEAPISEVMPSDVPELSIRKNLVALAEGTDGSLVAREGMTLEKGMKVRVTFTIDAGRDLDYVALTDERSACLEPIQQLSGYTYSDGTGYYREVRDNVTNIFFDRLPKGHHVISYDCTVSQEGVFSCGIATIQSQYSPLTTAHTAGEEITVN